MFLEYDILVDVVIKMNYVLYGEEAHRRKQQLEVILKQYHTTEFNLNIYDAKNIELHQIIEDANTPPFFEEHKVILIKNADFLTTMQEGSYDLKPLENYLKAPLESTVLIFESSQDKLDARKKIVKTLKKEAKVFYFGKLDEKDKESIVRSEIKKLNLKMTPNAIDMLIKRLPLDLHQIHNSLNVLALYEANIDEEVIEALIHKPLEDDVFALVNAVLENNVKKAYSLWLDFQRANIEPIYLTALLASSFRFLYQVKVLMHQGLDASSIASQLHAHPYRVRKNMETANRISLSECQYKLATLAELDQNMKSGKMDKKMAFELFLLELRREL